MLKTSNPPKDSHACRFKAMLLISLLKLLYMHTMYSARGMEPKPHTPLLWKSVWKVCKKLEIGPLYDPAIGLWAYTLKTTSGYTDACSSVFMAVLFTIERTWKQPRRSSTDDKWITKMWYSYTTGYYSAIKKFRTSHPKWVVPIKSFPSGLREHFRRGSEKILRASGDGKLQGLLDIDCSLAASLMSCRS